MSFSLPRVCRQRRKLGRHLCTSGRPDGLCGVGGHLRRPRGGLGCIGAGEWTCGCGGQAAHTSSRDITKLRKYQESAKRFFFSWAADFRCRRGDAPHALTRHSAAFKPKRAAGHVPWLAFPPTSVPLALAQDAAKWEQL